jgi:SAM-dependent methyltransferase
MEQITDWVKLWRELVEMRAGTHAPKSTGGHDGWQERARGFHKKVQERWAQPDSSRAFLLTQIDAQTTALDIGAGTGAWAILMARQAGRVTAVDPSAAMLQVLRENLEAEQIDNVDVVQAAWPDADVGVHDISLCSHAMYMTPDLPTFVRRMMEVTRMQCFFLMRAPLPDGVMAQAAQHVWGQPHDSPNFVVAFNVLMQMGIYANVLMEDTGEWGAWTNPSLEDAFAEAKRKLGLQGSSEHDDYLMGLLRERLTYSDGQWVWPPSMRSALVYWEV